MLLPPLISGFGDSPESSNIASLTEETTTEVFRLPHFLVTFRTFTFLIVLAFKERIFRVHIIRDKDLL